VLTLLSAALWVVCALNPNFKVKSQFCGSTVAQGYISTDNVGGVMVPSTVLHVGGGMDSTDIEATRLHKIHISSIP
jgi:hypothetical protein